MTTVLTEDEIIDVCDKVFFHAATAIDFARAIEAAVLAKLSEQKPVAWMFGDPFGAHYTDEKPDWYDALDVESITFLYTHPAPDVVRDAERYRWIKKEIRGGSFGTSIGWFDDDVTDWDADIDKARGAA